MGHNKEGCGYDEESVFETPHGEQKASQASRGLL